MLIYLFVFVTKGNGAFLSIFHQLSAAKEDLEQVLSAFSKSLILTHTLSKISRY